MSYVAARHATCNFQCTGFRQRRNRKLRVCAVSDNGLGSSRPEQTFTVKQVTFYDAMKFNGAAPETVNGRLAMMGLLMAAMQESKTGQTVLYQLSHGSWQSYLLLSVLVYASMVPILKGVKNEAFGIFSPRAEATNGRAAMLGFAVLVALEWKTGVPFF